VLDEKDDAVTHEPDKTSATAGSTWGSRKPAAIWVESTGVPVLPSIQPAPLRSRTTTKRAELWPNSIRSGSSMGVSSPGGNRQELLEATNQLAFVRPLELMIPRLRW